MTKFYFELPISTKETSICIDYQNTGDILDYKLIFFESECLNLRLITIYGDGKDDINKEVQTLCAPMKGYDSNEFEFEFTTFKKISVKFIIYETDKRRMIYVEYI